MKLVVSQRYVRELGGSVNSLDKVTHLICEARSIWFETLCHEFSQVAKLLERWPKSVLSLRRDFISVGQRSCQEDAKRE